MVEFGLLSMSLERSWFIFSRRSELWMAASIEYSNLRGGAVGAWTFVLAINSTVS